MALVSVQTTRKGTWNKSDPVTNDSFHVSVSMALKNASGMMYFSQKNGQCPHYGPHV